MRLEIKIPYNRNQYEKIKKNLISIKNIKKQYPSRKINSVYYDNLNNQIARDNLSGISRRCKLRVRYYGDEKSSNCYLEIKKNKISLDLKSNKYEKKYKRFKIK